MNHNVIFDFKNSLYDFCARGFLLLLERVTTTYLISVWIPTLSASAGLEEQQWWRQVTWRRRVGVPSTIEGASYRANFSSVPDSSADCLAGPGMSAGIGTPIDRRNYLRNASAPALSCSRRHSPQTHCVQPPHLRISHGVRVTYVTPPTIHLRSLVNVAAMALRATFASTFNVPDRDW